MGQILKFPVQASKFGYKRVRKCARPAESPRQLHLFDPPSPLVVNFAAGSSRFEQALQLDEHGDSRAAELYLRAIEEQDCIADAYCNLGIIESKAGHTAKAFDCFTTALKQDPRHFEAHFNLGNMYFDLEDFRLAQIQYELAVEVDPSFPNVYFNLALAQAINQDLQGALLALTRYQELVPKEEGHHANELLQTLRKSLAGARNPRLGSK